MPKRKRLQTNEKSDSKRGRDYFDLCSRFAAITSTNTALAMAYLQDRDWDLEKSVAAFLEEQRVNENQMDVAFIDLTESADDTDLSHRPSIAETVLNVLSWNVDGLDRSNVIQRTQAIASCLKSEPFHVVCLQEVTLETLRLFKSLLEEHYHIFTPTDNPLAECIHYFAIILVQKHSAIQLIRDSFHVHSFPNSTMGRHLLSVDITLDCDKFTGHQSLPGGTLRLRIFTSHLESCRESSAERKFQLKYAWTRMTQLHSSSSTTRPHASLFCGDLNLREDEIRDIGGVPANIVDVWEATGSRPELCNTWDPRHNSNASRLGFAGRRSSKQRVVFRYDRMYIHGHCLRPIDFGLRGLEKLPGAACFPSDHWGILGRFQVHSAERAL